MRWLIRLFSFLRSWFRKGQLEKELDEELRFHVERQAEEHIRRGMDPQEARREAQLTLGGVEQVKEEVRGVRTGAWLDTLGQDVRFGARMLARKPGFAAVVLLTLVLGIGINTTIFSVVNTFLFRPLVVRDIDRLVRVFGMRGEDPFGVSVRDYLAWKESARSFESLGIAGFQSFNLTGGDADPERIQAGTVAADYFPTLGVRPLLGRNVLPEETEGEGARVALISYSLWQRRFGGQEGILGRTLTLDGLSYSIVGVLPRGFDLPWFMDVWVPLTLDTIPEEQRGGRQFFVSARLLPGVSMQEARTELKAINTRLAEEYPNSHRGWGIEMISHRQDLLADFHGNVQKGLLILLGAVGFLLLIATANLASLYMSRILQRGHELAVRLALGAGRGRLLRQLVTENLLIVVLGGIGGILLASWIVLPLLGWLPLQIQSAALGERISELQMDYRVPLFGIGVALLTGLLFTLVPARQITRLDLASFTKGRSPGLAFLPGLRRFLYGTVVLQMAVSLPLLVGAGFLVKSFANLQQLPLGFRPENTFALEMVLPTNRYPTHAERALFLEQVMERMAALPGVLSAGFTTNLPLDNGSWDSSYECEGRPPRDASELLMTADRLVSPGYFGTAGFSLLKGRGLTDQDGGESQPVVVITESLARSCWGEQDPIGKRVRRRTSRPDQFPWRTVIGLLGDVREDRGAFRRDRPAWYIPYPQGVFGGDRPVKLVIRTEEEPGRVADQVRRTVLALDENQPVSSILLLQAHVEEILAPDRFSASLLSLFSLASLLLAAMGSFGTISFVMAQRTKEVGIRMALGAQRHSVLWLVISQGLKLALVGVVLGLAAAAVLCRFLSSLLFEVAPTDVATYAAVSGLLITVALLACYLPARRATKVDPMVALRYE